MEEGLALLDEALAQVERTGERWNEAELHRVKGSCCCGPRRRSRGSRVLLPTSHRRSPAAGGAVLGAARHDQPGPPAARPGRGDEAREMLAAIYGWFTEGFDTPDLVEAKALLEELT